jgi:Fic family protein
MTHKTKIRQGIKVGVAGKVNAAAIAAIAAIGSAVRYIFFTPKADDPVAAIAGFHFYFGFIYEFHDYSPRPRFEG